MKRLRVGIVGCGGIARAHLGGYRTDGAADVVSVYDVSDTAASTFAQECDAHVAKSIEDMAFLEHLDAVSICTPPGLHLATSLPFLHARIPILCEKPLEANLRNAERLAAEARNSRTLFMVAYCHRFHPAIVELRKLVKTGVLGKPLLFRNVFGGYFELTGNHRADPVLSGGGCVMDNCSHAVDLFRFLAGEPTEVQAMTASVAQKAKVEDIGLLHLSARNKVFGELLSSYSLRVCGNWVEWYRTKGTALVSYWNVNRPDLVYRLIGDSDWTMVDCSHLPDRFSAEVAHFLDCVRHKKKTDVNVTDGLRTSAVIDAAYKSAQRGRRVSLA